MILISFPLETSDLLDNPPFARSAQKPENLLCSSGPSACLVLHKPTQLQNLQGIPSKLHAAALQSDPFSALVRNTICESRMREKLLWNTYFFPHCSLKNTRDPLKTACCSLAVWSFLSFTKQICGSRILENSFCETHSGLLSVVCETLAANQDCSLLFDSHNT